MLKNTEEKHKHRLKLQKNTDCVKNTGRSITDCNLHTVELNQREAS